MFKNNKSLKISLFLTNHGKSRGRRKEEKRGTKETN